MLVTIAPKYTSITPGYTLIRSTSVGKKSHSIALLVTEGFGTSRLCKNTRKLSIARKTEWKSNCISYFISHKLYIIYNIRTSISKVFFNTDK